MYTWCFVFSLNCWTGFIIEWKQIWTLVLKCFFVQILGFVLQHPFYEALTGEDEEDDDETDEAGTKELFR